MSDDNNQYNNRLPLDEYFQRNIPYEKKLGNLFLSAANGEITISDLRFKVDDIITELRELDEMSAEYDFLIEDAFKFIDELHDDFAVEELKKYDGILPDYANILLGKKSRIYTFSPREGIVVTVKYLKL